MNISMAIRRLYRAARLGLLSLPKRTAYGVELFGPRLDGTFHMIMRGSYGDFVMGGLKDADPSCHFLDIGANIGLFSCALNEHFEGKVHAFEPNPKTFGYLQKNLLHNGADNARAWCAGMFDEDKPSATLNLRAFHSGAASIKKDHSSHSTRISLIGPEILRNIFQGDERFCIKVDVEGAEANVLRALHSTGILDRTERLVIEMSVTMNSEEQLDEIRALLDSAGLKLKDRTGTVQYADELYVRQ